MSPPMIAAMDAGGHVRDWRHPALAGYVIIILAFGVLGGWSAIAKLDRAVVAPATVSIDTNRKLVQHLEGGIVKEILVREGQVVEAGDVLIRLDDVQARAGRDTVRNQLLAAETREARRRPSATNCRGSCCPTRCGRTSAIRLLPMPSPTRPRSSTTGGARCRARWISFSSAPRNWRPRYTVWRSSRTRPRSRSGSSTRSWSACASC